MSDCPKCKWGLRDCRCPKPEAPSAREFYCRPRGEYDDGFCVEVNVGRIELKYSTEIHVIEHAAYERLERELAARVNVSGLLDRVHAELERVKGVCADLNRQNNTTFAQSCKNYEELNKERARNAGLVEALEHYAKLEDWPMLPVIAREALAKFGGEK